MTFRAAEPDDVDDLTSLMREYYAEEGYPFAEDEARAAFARLLSDPALGRVWLAHAAAEPVGYLIVTFGYSLEYGGRDAFLDDLFIMPSHRGRGLGTGALALAEQACREAGVRALHLEVERAKTAAQTLYGRHGFVDHDRFLMTKRLGPDA